jgi:hypothetical protein
VPSFSRRVQAPDASLLTPHRHGLLDVLGTTLLAQAHPPRLALTRADTQLLLGARHRVIGRRAGGLAADWVRSGMPTFSPSLSTSVRPGKS